MFETIPCYYCNTQENSFLLHAEEDLTGKPGTFTFVTCNQCGLAYQNPRVKLERIGEYYDSEYIAHRLKKDWGVLTPLYERAMSKHDRDKQRLVSRYVSLNENSRVLDVGCAVGSFLLRLGREYGCSLDGVDFKDCSHHPGFENIAFHLGLFYEQALEPDSFDLITMWHFLEHDYDPLRSLRFAAQTLKRNGRLIIEVPRLDSVTYHLFRERWPGLQAPQHTVLFSKKSLTQLAEKAGLVVEEHLPYGAFPNYFYLFCGTAFKLLKGKGLDLNRLIYPYFAGQVLLSPLLLLEKRLNLAMQTIVCRRP